MTKELEVVDVENRGTEEAPFGYVYFSDDTRLGWTPGHGEDIDGLWASNWGGNTPRHFGVARKAIKKYTKK